MKYKILKYLYFFIVGRQSDGVINEMKSKCLIYLSLEKALINVKTTNVKSGTKRQNGKQT